MRLMCIYIYDRNLLRCFYFIFKCIYLYAEIKTSYANIHIHLTNTKIIAWWPYTWYAIIIWFYFESSIIGYEKDASLFQIS